MATKKITEDKNFRKIEINDYTYISDKIFDFGECENCSEKAVAYNETGQALCEDCLDEFHDKLEDDN